MEPAREPDGLEHDPGIRPDRLPVPPDVPEVERLVRRAIDERRVDLLDVVGYGEYSLTLRCVSPEGGEAAMKRVTPLRSAAAAAEYRAVTREYIHAFEGAGVPCVVTDLLQHDRSDGSAVVYHHQPMLDPNLLVSNILRATPPTREHPVVDALVAACAAAVGPNVGIDSQCSNWYWHDDRVWHLDFSTPMLFDDEQHFRFDVEGFLGEYPAVLRWPIKREFFRLGPMYRDVEFVMIDLVTLLHREGLAAWTDSFVEAIRRLHGIEVDAEAAAEKYRSDASFYVWLYRSKLLQRTWIQRTGRRYEALLPERSSFAAR